MKAEKPNQQPGVFARRVLAVVRRIPPGWVATYGDVARLAGTPRAHRAVGNIMRECRLPDVPCHRVIGAGGALGGYGGNLELKRNLLRAEGLSVGLKRVREFANCRWDVALQAGRRKAEGGKQRAGSAKGTTAGGGRKRKEGR